MKDTKNQSNISDTDGSNCYDFSNRTDPVPKCKIDSNISEIQEVIASKKYPVDGKAHLAIMNKIFQISLSCLKTSPSHIYGNVKTHRKKNDI